MVVTGVNGGIDAHFHGETKKYYLLFFSFMIFSSHSACLLGVASSANPNVTLPYGDIMGTTLPVEGYDDSLVFYAIPYAQPPLGDLRFKGPQPVTAWEGVRIATSPG